MVLRYLGETGRAAGVLGPGGLAAVPLQHGFLTAVSTSKGSVELIVWRRDETGLRRLAGSRGVTPGPVSGVALLGLPFQNYWLTASAGASGALYLQTWLVRPDTGKVTPYEAITHGKATTVAAGGGGVLFRRAPDGSLGLYAMGLDGKRRLRIRDEVSAGKIKSLAACSADPPGFVYSAVADSKGRLKVIVWSVDDQGSIHRLGSSGSDGERITAVAVCRGRERRLATVARTVEGTLKVIPWEVSEDGSVVKRLGDGGAGGKVGAISCDNYDTFVEDDPFHPGVWRLVTTVQTRTGHLKPIVWEVQGSSTVRLDTFAGNAARGDLVESFADPNSGEIVNVLREAESGRLKLARWQVADDSGVSVEDQNLVLYDDYGWESTAAVLAPTKKSPGGRIILSLGEGRGGRAAARWVSRDLTRSIDFPGPYPSFSQIASKALQTIVDYPLDTEVPAPFTRSQEARATDCQTIRLGPTKVLVSKNGYRWTKLDPTPSWVGEVEFRKSTDLDATFHPRARNAIYLFQSVDGGSTWSRHSVVDAAEVADGMYGWPQPWKGSKGDWYIGGFDRSELYRDPWSGDLFISGKADSGPYSSSSSEVDNRATVIFRYEGSKKGWRRIFHRSEPRAAAYMTSTPNFGLVAVSDGSVPVLHVMPRGEKKVRAAGHPIGATVGGKVVQAGSPFADVGSSPVAVARMGDGSDGVWVAYPALNSDGQATYIVCAVELKKGGVNVDHVATIDASNSRTHSCVLGTFVEDDYVNGGVGAGAAALFYWVEAAPPGTADAGEITVRYTVLSGRSAFTEPAALSVEKGEPRRFARLALGHYLKGAPFRWGGRQRFLAQWAEEDPTTGSQRVAGNIVTVD